LQDEDYQAQLAQAAAAIEAAQSRTWKTIAASASCRTLASKERLPESIRRKHRSPLPEAGINAVQADVVRTRAERTRQEALLASQAATPQRVEAAVADEQRLAAQAASRAADLEQAKTALRSNEIAVESERRSKDVLESQERQLAADLHAKEAAFTVAQVNLGYAKIQAPADGTVGERQVRPGQLVSPGTQVMTLVADTKWVQANFRETQLTHMKVGDAGWKSALISIPEKLFVARCWKSLPPAAHNSPCSPRTTPQGISPKCPANSREDLSR